MTELFVSVFSASVIIGVTSQLIHRRHRGGVCAFSLGTMLLFVVITAVPTVGEFKLDIESLIPDNGEEGEYYFVASDALSRAVASAVSDEFGFSEENVSVELINFVFENMRCDTVVVTLRGAAALGDYRRVEKFVSEMGIGECRVDVQIG
ncbi:MAG: hypothetical protein IJW66_00935 [Clostridia bacterium]|nr:hypothetical protein [Clostridia bacterium]